MVENSKHIKSLVAGLVANNDAKVDQLTRELVESIFPKRKELVTELLRQKIQGELT